MVPPTRTFILFESKSFYRSTDKLRCWIEKGFILKRGVGSAGSISYDRVIITSIVKYTFIIMNITFLLC